MRCYVHKEKEAIGACVNCGKFICEECNVEIDEKSMCKACVQGKINGKTRDNSEKYHGKHKHKHEKFRHSRNRNDENLDVDNFVEERVEKVAKSRFILFLFTFFLPTGFNYYYLGLKKRAIFFLTVYIVAFINLVPAISFFIRYKSSFSRTSYHGIAMIYFLILMFIFACGYIFKLAVFWDTLRIRKRMSKGIKIKDTTKDLVKFLNSYNMLIISLVISMFIMSLHAVFVYSFIRGFIIVASFPAGAVIALGIPYLVFKSFFYINCVSASKFDSAKIQSHPAEPVDEAPRVKAKEEPKEVMKTAKNQEQMSERDKLLHQGKIMAHKFNEKSISLYYTNIGEQVKELSDIVNRMFDFVEKNPQKLRLLNKFIEYYMPTTLELLDNYETLKEQGLQSKNIDDSSEKIESTIPNLILAFRNQLDSLFEEKALNIDADINVLNDLLKREGLIED